MFPVIFHDFTISQIMVLASIITLNILFMMKKAKLPLHPDSGLFLYKAILSREGEEFKPGKYGGRGYTGWEGDYIPYQSKFIIYKFMEWYYTFVPSNAKLFRYFYATYNSFTVFLVFYLGDMVYSTNAGLLGAFIYTLFCANPFADSSQIHAEHYAVLPLILSIIMCLKGIILLNPMLLFFSGVLFAVLIGLFKVTYLPEFICTGIFTLILSGLNGLFSICFGFFIFFIFLYITCRKYKLNAEFFVTLGLRDFFSQKGSYRNFMPSKIQSEGISSLSPYLVLKMSSYSLPFLVFSFLLYLLNGFQFLPVDYFFFSLLLASSAAIIIQGKYYSSHLLPAYPIVSIISGIGIDAWYQQYYFTNNKLVYVWIPVLLVVSLFLWLFELCKFHFIYKPLKYHMKKAAVRGYKTVSFLAEEMIADFINKNSDKKERIVQWGYHQELYVLAKRRAAVGNKLEYSLQTDPELSDVTYGIEWRQWLINAIQNQKPLFITDMQGSLNINALNRATGLKYELYKIFYELFPFYKLNKGECVKPVSIDVLDLTNFHNTAKIDGKFCTQQEFIEFINGLVNEGKSELADTYTNNQLAKLLRDWESINY